MNCKAHGEESVTQMRARCVRQRVRYRSVGVVQCESAGIESVERELFA